MIRELMKEKSKSEFDKGLRDKLILAVEKYVTGVRVLYSYKENESDKYCLHIEVENEKALCSLCGLGGMVNAPVMVYSISPTEFRYTLALSENSRNILLAFSEMEEGVQP